MSKIFAYKVSKLKQHKKNMLISLEKKLQQKYEQSN